MANAFTSAPLAFVSLDKAAVDFAVQLVILILQSDESFFDLDQLLTTIVKVKLTIGQRLFVHFRSTGTVLPSLCGQVQGGRTLFQFDGQTSILLFQLTQSLAGG